MLTSKITGKTIDTKSYISTLVVGDSGCDTIGFIIPKMYGTLDLSDATWKIKYVASNDKGDEAMLDFEEDGDNLIVSWTPSGWATYSEGQLKFQLEVTLTDGTIWHTKQAYVSVKPSLDVEEPGGYTLTILEQYLALYSESLAEAQGYAESAQQSALEAEEAKEAILNAFTVETIDGEDTVVYNY
jgi:hypothetical protein